jgi:hypothetical protein
MAALHQKVASGSIAWIIARKLTVALVIIFVPAISG